MVICPEEAGPNSKFSKLTKLIEKDGDSFDEANLKGDDSNSCHILYSDS
jgi:hypothetical protein